MRVRWFAQLGNLACGGSNERGESGGKMKSKRFRSTNPSAKKKGETGYKP